MPPLSRLCAVALACALLASCSTTEERQPAPPAPDLEASITQFRHQEGTRDLRAGVTNVGATTVTVTRATLDWAGFEPTSVEVDDWVLDPGGTAAFTMRYGDARCDDEPTEPPRLDVVVDGVERLLLLKVEDPRLLDRLHLKECARQRLDAAASVSMELAGSTIMRGGEEYLPGTVVLRRTAGSDDTVTVVDLGGSVLLHVDPREGRPALPARLEPGRDTVRLPVLVGSVGRCDGHALGNSQQTFLLSVYVRLDSDPAQRVITVPDKQSKATLNALIRRDCGLAGPTER